MNTLIHFNNGTWHVKIYLLLSGSYPSCQQTRQVWQEACEQFGLELISYDIEDTRGETLARTLAVNTFPALIVENKVCAVGHPNRGSAYDLIAKLKRPT